MAAQRERMRPEPLQLDQSTAGHSRESHGRPGSSTPETAAQRLGSMPDGLHTLHEAAISPIGLAPLPALSNSPSIDSSKRRKKPKLSVDLPPGEQLKVIQHQAWTAARAVCNGNANNELKFYGYSSCLLRGEPSMSCAVRDSSAS